MQGCLSFTRIPEVGDPEFLKKQNEQYKPYAAPQEKRSNARNFHELKQQRVREAVESGEKWRKNMKGPPPGVSFKRVSAFKMDDGKL